MIMGLNTHVPHEGTDYHVQIEDLEGQMTFDVRVYVGGSVVFHKRQAYGDTLTGVESPQVREALVNEELGKLLNLVKAAIQRGRIRPSPEDPPQKGSPGTARGAADAGSRTRHGGTMFRTLCAKEERLVAGLTSGTSADGIDVALVRIRGQGLSVELQLVDFDTLKFHPAVRDKILAAQGPAGASARDIILLSSYLGELFAHAVGHICKKAVVSPQDLDLIGSHGLTLYHHPAPEHFPGFQVTGTLQVGNAAILAERTGITVISDFRARDMAAGGQGSPLAPYLDYVIFNHRSRSRIILNVGGVASLTAIPADTTIDEVMAFDTGPGNGLMDLAAAHFSSGKLTFDKDGQWARSGQCNRAVLARLMEHPYFVVRPPKSLDKEVFGRPFLPQVLDLAKGMSPADTLATLAAFTVQSIATGIMEFVLQKARYEEIIVTGGGARNPAIVAGMQQAFPRMSVGPGDHYHIPSKAKEAVLMAFLANETLAGLPGNVPSATGSRKPVVLGSITPGANAFDAD